MAKITPCMENGKVHMLGALLVGWDLVALNFVCFALAQTSIHGSYITGRGPEFEAKAGSVRSGSALAFNSVLRREFF